MEILPNIVLPLWSIITFIASITILIIFVLIIFYQNSKFKFSCKKTYSNSEIMAVFKKKYSNRILLRKSRIIERIAKENGNLLLTETGLNKLWENKLNGIMRFKYLKKILIFFPERGLFLCLKNSPSKTKYVKMFSKYFFSISEENILKKIAIAGLGEDFNGKHAFSLLKQYNNNIEKIFQLTEHNEWFIRFFAVKIILQYKTDKANNYIWTCFRDSSEKIRTIVCKEFSSEEKEKLSLTLFNLILNDPTYSVRQVAKDRLLKDFPQFAINNLDSLSKVQKIHLLTHLSADSKTDEEIAFNFLESDDLEIRNKAALYLQSQGSLSKLFVGEIQKNNIGKQRLNTLLSNACEANVSKFLDNLSKTENSESLLFAGKILQKTGNCKYITLLAEKVFSPYFKDQHKEYYKIIYTNTVNCIYLRGNDKALELLNNELKNNYKNNEIYEIIFSKLPSRGALFVPTLIDILYKDDFANKTLLRKTIEIFPPYLFIESLNNIISSSNTTILTSAKKEALKIFAELKLPYCIQTILENIKLFSYKERQDFADIIKQFDKDILIERIKILFKENDSETISSILSILPKIYFNSFIDITLDFITDTDPDVRIAAINAFSKYGEQKYLVNISDLLRDPVERVRKEAAYILAESDNLKALSQTENILSDIHEVFTIKESAILGLANANNLKTIEILTKNINNYSLQNSIINALSLKTEEKELIKLVEIYIESDIQTKEQLLRVFNKINKTFSNKFIKMLSNTTEIKFQTITEILLKTGFIDETILKLKHRKITDRLKAAELLSLIETKQAYYGILLAGRDPSFRVRKTVEESIKKLNTTEKAQILQSLKNDPDKRVRNLTLWTIKKLEKKDEVK